MMCAPMSRMDVISDSELNEMVGNSKIAKKYNEVINRESAFEILKNKIAAAKEITQEEKSTSPTTKNKEESSMADSVGNVINSPIGKVVLREVTRGLLGVLGLGSRSSTKKRSLW